ncbi:MAG TPA: 50S ribosomal protein L11 methyltransferase [Trueperaceae bacterium]|nr:50S ribosomal protein L11 methyltransferase [Trueperaceae bacterium]
MKTFRLADVTGESQEAAMLWDLGCLGLVEESGTAGGAILAYFDAEVDTGLPGTWEDILDVDDVALYRASLKPVRIGCLVIAPSHATVEASDGDMILWLDPGSAFGTGHHETTRLALAALERSDLRGKSVIDVGSGTGVLTLAADRLGADSAVGLDVDKATLAVARENAARNRSRARFALGTLGSPGLPSRCDVLVANLYAELHAELMPLYAATLLPGGRAILTGILNMLRQTVLTAVSDDLEVVAEQVDGEWALMELRHKEPDV